MHNIDKAEQYKKSLKYRLVYVFNDTVVNAFYMGLGLEYGNIHRQ